MPPKSSASTTGGKIAGKRRGRENTLGVGVTANPTVSVFEHHSEKELHDRLLQQIFDSVSDILTASHSQRIQDYWKTHKSESDDENSDGRFPVGEYFYAWFIQNRNALTRPSLEKYLRDTAFRFQSFPAASLAPLHRALVKSCQDENNNNNDDDGNAATRATIFDIADEKLFGCRHIVGDMQKISDANARHVHIDGDGNDGFVSPSPDCATFLDLWIKSDSSLLIVGGSSGSGKTVVGVHLGKLWDRKQNPLTKNKHVADLIKNSRSVVCYLERSSLNWSEEEASKLSSKTDRDEQVTAAVLGAITKLFSDHKKTGKAEVCSSAVNNDGTPRNVVIVIDELGSVPIFVRGLASISLALARNLHQRFFGQSCSSNEHPRVAFIACGTGLAVQKSKDGSKPSKFTSILLDEYPLPLKHMFSNFGLSRTRQQVYNPFLDRLERDSSSTRNTNTSHALQPIELITADLLRNARCAALFCLEMHALIDNRIGTEEQEKQIHRLSRFPTYWCRFELPALANRVIERYIDMNGLNSFHSPLNVLLCSLAVVVFKLPVLPASIPKDLMNAFAPSNSDDTSLSSVLSSGGGVLVDQSFTFAGNDSHPQKPPNTVTLPVTNDNTNSHNQSSILFPKSGRYFMSRASLAKIHFYLDINRRTFNENGLELSIGDFCFCVVAAAPYFMRMKDEILMQNNKNNNKNNNNNKPLMNEAALEQFTNVDGQDVLYPLKKDLVFEETIRERATFPPSSSPGGANHPTVKYFQNEQQLAREDQKQEVVNRWNDLASQLQGVSTGESIVVMRTAHQEPFADIIVAGLNKIVFIQVKSRREGSLSNPSKKVEFAKMGVGKASESKPSGTVHYPTTNQQKLFRELVKNCRGSEDSKVQISAFILISSSSSSTDLGIVDFGVENNLKISVTGIRNVELKTATTITFNASPKSPDQNHPLFPAHPNNDTNTSSSGQCSQSEDVKPQLLSGLNSMSNYF